MVSEVEDVFKEIDALGIHVDDYFQSTIIIMYIGLGMLRKAWTWFEMFHIGGGMSCEFYASNIDVYGYYAKSMTIDKSIFPRLGGLT